MSEGRKISVSRETLVNFIESAVAKINKSQAKTHSIFKTFKMCGLNHFDNDTSAFQTHLESLNKKNFSSNPNPNPNPNPNAAELEL